MYCMHEMEPETNCIPAATGPPPPYEGPLDYSGATPSAPFGQNNPLVYQEIGGYTPQPHQPPQASEQAPLIRPPVPAPRRNQVNERQLPVGPVTERFSFEKFVFVWLGIGRSYSKLCLVIFVFIAIWGIGVIGLSVTSIVTTTINQRNLQPRDIYLIYSLCIASGITFVLIGLCWSFTYCWNRKVPTERNFTALGCYFCFLVMLVACCAVGVGIELYEKQDYFIPGRFYRNLAIYEWLPPLLALGSLATTVAIFLCCSCCCVCCCKRHVGRVC